MMKNRLINSLQRSLRRSQSGQSLVILAMGFLALLGFVGIVTDVSLMFVRYSTLTRAVDAASIAAAGQVRRQIPFQSEIADNCTGVDAEGNAWTPSNPCPEAEAAAFSRSFGNIGVAARQFIEFYGLNPQAVLIDMCFTVSTRDPDTGVLMAIDPELQDDFDELCVGPQGRNAERKLIKVTAQIESPTVFLRLLGFPAITLEANSISETAVLDVVLIMDVSESMLNQTTPDTWAAEGYTEIYVPPDIWYNKYNNNNGDTSSPGFGVARNHNFADITGFNNYDPGSPDPYPGNNWYHFRYDLSRRTPAQVASLLCIDSACNLGSGNRSPFEITVLDHPGYVGATSLPLRSECKVGYYPNAFNNPIPTSLNNLYKAAGLNGGLGWTATSGARDAFVPTYNFYRCCNDPNGDGSFRDLLCQPFREARDATEAFLQRIDFLRGDRVAFVTFDRQAFLVRVEVDESTNTYSHMIDNESLALNTLKDFIGVRSEPGFYEPTTLPDGTQVLPWAYDAATNPWARSSQLGLHDYEVFNNCPFQDATLQYPYSPSTSSGPGTPDYDPTSWPNRLTPDSFASDSAGQRMYPRGTGAGGWQSRTGYGANRSYDLWASCRGTNIGAALREAGNALLDPLTTRTNGSVWVMVFLSDGAAGASDPVFDSANGLIPQPEDAYYPYNSDTTRVTYGRFGLCPAGTTSNPTELTQFTETPYAFPFCSDEVPETRRFCFDPNLQAMIAGESTRLYVDLARCERPEHRDYYDVDDYARDWADWIGLVEPRGLTSTSQRNLTQLPTIFTIGFGLNFAGGTTRCQDTYMVGTDVPDCLGEELLRYIADVGDNFRMDTDYQQDLLDDTYLNDSLTDDDYGPRGECEDPDAAPGTIFPKTAKTSCGNYYNAPGGDELNRVFDDIASRMFTRLTQ